MRTILPGGNVIMREVLGQINSAEQEIITKHFKMVL